MAKTKTESNKPVFEARLNSIRVSVWANDGEDGQKWFNTTITRRFKTADEWSENSSFAGLGDLALVAEATRLARDFIAGQSSSVVD